ncbi:MAG: hypothetical protein ACR2HF_14790 [Methylococcaceae bacterium]
MSDEKRLKELKNPKLVTGKLTYSDLVLVLKNDPDIRSIMYELVSEKLQESPIAKNNPTTAPAITNPDPSSETLRQQLTPQLKLLKLIQADSELCGDWLGGKTETEGQQLVRLIAIAAQWDRIGLLWDRLKNRCQTENRPCNESEQAILDGMLAIHNLIWNGNRTAKLATVSTGTIYDYTQHLRVNPMGETIKALWLPGLINVAGTLQKLSLVET